MRKQIDYFFPTPCNQMHQEVCLVNQENIQGRGYAFFMRDWYSFSLKSLPLGRKLGSSFRHICLEDISFFDHLLNSRNMSLMQQDQWLSQSQLLPNAALAYAMRVKTIATHLGRTADLIYFSSFTTKTVFEKENMPLLYQNVQEAKLYQFT